MSTARSIPLPDPPRGLRLFKSRREILRARELFAYQHMLLRAWEEMNLCSVLTVNGIPTVYVRKESVPVSPQVAAEAHRQFWNQGVATVLLLIDPNYVRVFSSMTTPTNPADATEADIEKRLVEKLEWTSQIAWADRFYLQIANGQYYSGGREAKFDPEQAVDAYLLKNLAAVRDTLVDQGLSPTIAHAFLGRLLFTCYLCDRGIVDLKNYFRATSWHRVHEILEAHENPILALYETLFPALKREFNSSMFDEDLSIERNSIKQPHLEVVRRFLHGDNLSRTPEQFSLGFWAYDFKFIPVETISAIYENFLEKEDSNEKRTAGAFYTPRLLAEMALDLAIEGLRPLYKPGRRFIDPACGSGIFLVLLFNRLAAEWRMEHGRNSAPQERADALLERLDTITGVDKNATACRIACFSLYLAFLDQFDPPDVRAYKLHTGKKLPNLLKYQSAKRSPEHPVIHEGDFFNLAKEWPRHFDLAIGNPPWSGRGTKQVAQHFMERVPDILKETGRACLLLPSKVFLNRTDLFQSRWLRCVTLERLIQLADYRFILFKDALCPCSVAVFTPKPPDEEKHLIEFCAPKVSRLDLRDGAIEVSADDRKWIPLRLVLAAAEQKASSVAWKTHLWGSARDLKFLEYMFTLPRLGDLAGTAAEVKKGKKRWYKGQGFQPLRITSKTDNPKDLVWPHSYPFVTPELIDDLFMLPSSMTYQLGTYLSKHEYRLDKLHRPRGEEIYRAPLVLFNQGFSTAAFFDYPVRFQHSLQSIAGEKRDSDYLLWLSVVLRSKLARYFAFHTAANLGTERDKVHLPEVMRLPFFLPDDSAAQRGSATTLEKAVKFVRELQSDMEQSSATFLLNHRNEEFGNLDDTPRDEWLKPQREKARKLQAKLESYVYDYYGLTNQEKILVEDTCEIFDRSDTPGSLDAARNIPTLQPVDASGLEPYSSTLVETLNSWTKTQLRVRAGGGVDPEVGLGLVEISQAQTVHPFERRSISKPLAHVLKRLHNNTTQRTGQFSFQRNGLIFDGPRIYLIKPALRGRWTRVAALNDANAISTHIAEARRRASISK